MDSDRIQQLLASPDPSAKQVAIGHLTAEDYRDERVLGALLESLLGDDEETALRFALSCAWNVDPEQRPDVVRLLADTLADTERRRSSRSAYVMAAIHLLYENSRATPPDALLREIADIVTASDDSAAWPGASDLAGIAVHRGSGVVSEWLRGPRPELIALAVAAVAGIDTPSPELCASLRAAQNTLQRGGGKLPPQVVAWTQAKISGQLEQCR